MSYNELKQHGSAEFPIELYRIDKNHPKYEMAYHWHTEFEIIRILSGSLKIMLNYNEILAKKGDIIFVNSETVHGAVPLDCVYECVVFSNELLYKPDSEYNDFFDNLLNHNIYIYEQLNNAPIEFVGFVNAVFDAMLNRQKGYKYIVMGALYNIFAVIINYGLYGEGSKIVNSRNAKNVLKIKKALAYMRSSYDSQLTLSDISKQAGISDKYFCAFFKQMTDQSPFEYLTNYRIERAARKLINTDLSVTAIAFECGFNDLSYFIKTFKKVKGVTPKCFRNNMM